MKKLILTLDYELYGNGSGNVFKHIIEPTESLLKIAKKYGVKYTFFFEVVEYWKLKEEWNNGNKMGYDTDPCEAMAEQMREAYSEGHDVQLHFHPQWVEAKWIDCEWKVNLNNWRLSGYNGEGESSLINLFEKGIETLDNILRPVDQKYKCIAIRSGGYNAQPSQNIVKAMKKFDIIIDSSIVPGAVEKGKLSSYDYSKISNEISYWRVNDNLECADEKGGIIELPIMTLPIIRFTKYFSWERIKSILRNRKSAQDSFNAKTATQEGNKISKLGYLLGTEYQTWDFCLFSKSLHKQFLNRVESTNRQFSVLVGHPKSFTSSDGLEYLLKATSGKYKYITMSSFYDNATR